MNENLKRWIETLETTDLPQAEGSLCRIDKDGEVAGYCCLGIAMELAVEAGVQNPGADDDPAYRGRRVYRSDIQSGEFYTSGLTPEVQSWLGLRDSLGSAFSARGLVGLAALNDSGATFTRIANVLRRHTGAYAHDDETETP